MGGEGNVGGEGIVGGRKEFVGGIKEWGGRRNWGPIEPQTRCGGEGKWGPMGGVRTQRIMGWETPMSGDGVPKVLWDREPKGLQHGEPNVRRRRTEVLWDGPTLRRATALEAFLVSMRKVRMICNGDICLGGVQQWGRRRRRVGGGKEEPCPPPPTPPPSSPSPSGRPPPHGTQ